MCDGLSKLDGGSEGRFIENCDRQHFICSSWHTDWGLISTHTCESFAEHSHHYIGCLAIVFFDKIFKTRQNVRFLPSSCFFCWNISLGRLCYPPYANIFLCSPIDPVDIELWHQNGPECVSTIQHGPMEPITKPLLEYSTRSPAWPSVPQVYPFRALSTLSVIGDCVSDKYHRQTQCQVTTIYIYFP